MFWQFAGGRTLQIKILIQYEENVWTLSLYSIMVLLWYNKASHQVPVLYGSNLYFLQILQHTTCQVGSMQYLFNKTPTKAIHAIWYALNLGSKVLNFTTGKGNREGKERHYFESMKWLTYAIMSSFQFSLGSFKHDG